MNQKEAALYLKRLHYEDTVQPGTDALEKLIRAHLEQIPFENLDVFDFGKVPDLNEKVLFDKVVVQKRGGVCFELNLLFLSLLKCLNYQVYPVAARILWNKTEMPPLTHVGLITEVEEELFYCDVGYGGPGPKGLIAIKPGEQEVDGCRFRFLRMTDGDYRLDRLHHGEWKALLQFADRPVRRLDFQVLNFYCARNPIIMFTQKRVINLCTPEGSKALTDLELTVHENGEIRRTIYKDLEELEKGLEVEFGLRVSLAGSIRKGE